MASNNVPQPQSYEQLLADALSSYAAKVGIDDFNVGSAVTSFFEVTALMTARASGDVFQILRDFSVDRATGDALQRLALENNVTPITAFPATGKVSITDTSFTKISTKIYAGSIPPNIGSNLINVSDASQFPSSGAIYIGRGTPNVEGPISYSSAPVQVGNFWQITLNSPTTEFHNVNESVILAQHGNRAVSAGSALVIAPAVGANPDISYSVTTSAIILDGETTVNNVLVTALLPGADGNAPSGAIKRITGVSFAASVTNPVGFTNGRDNETDDQLRVRIKRALASKGLGTPTAIQSAVIGAVAPDEAATIVSTNLIQASYGAVLFIDNGSGYEAKSTGVGIESIVDSAIGGEQFFQLAMGGTQSSVAKAYIQSTLSAPFDLVGGDSLSVEIGGQSYQHDFVDADFRSPGSVTAYEITASINAHTSLGFEATTAGGGIYVVIRSKTEGNDSVQITAPITTGRDVSVQLGFPVSEIDTLRLYKNKLPLSKDGKVATVLTNDQSLWSHSIISGDTLILSVDGTDPITYTFTDADFVKTGLYVTVTATNSLESWVEVFNNKLTGVTAEIFGQQISITSNLNANNRASVVIDPNSTLVINRAMFPSTALSSTGKASDYTLSRNTGQFELSVPLVVGDKLQAGSNETEGRLDSADISVGSITFASNAYVWLLPDTTAKIINTGVLGNTVLGVSKPATNVVRYTSSVPSAFLDVIVGDYVIVWCPDLVAANRLEGRVYNVTATTLDILITSSEWASVSVTPGVTFTQGFVVLRSANAPQKFELLAGTQTLDQVAANLQAQTHEFIFTVELEKNIVIRTRTKDLTGSAMIVTADGSGGGLQFISGTQDQSKDSLIAFYDSQTYEAQMPLFLHAGFASGTSALPPDSYIASFVSTVSLAGRNPNDLICMVQPYGSVALSTTGDIAVGSNQLLNLASLAGISFGDTVSSAGRYYSFVVTAANATIGATYTNNTQTFTVTETIVGGTTLIANGSGADPLSSGTLTKTSGTGDATITYSLFSFSGSGIPSGTTVVAIDTVHNSITMSHTATAAAIGASVSFLNPAADNQAAHDYAQITSIAGTTIGITNRPAINDSPLFPSTIRRLRTVDRYFIANPLDFGSNDTAVVIVDNDPSTNSFEIPFYRIATTNTSLASNSMTFNAYDTDSGATASFATSFGSSFDFSNFKVLMQAKHVVKPTPPQTAILYRSTPWGRSGEFVRIAYVYPPSQNLSVTSTVTSDELVHINIALASGALKSTGITSTTAWNIAVTPNTPSAGIDQVTYSWAGQYTFTVTAANATVGAVYTNNGHSFVVTNTIAGGTTLLASGTQANPPLASGTLTKFSGTGDATITFSSFSFSGTGTNPSMSLTGGEYVNISQNTAFNVNNTGVFRVSTQAGFTPTATSFSVQMPSGVGVNQSGVSTLVNGAIIFYSASPTTAAQINTYVNANLSNYVSSALVNDSGTGGSGVVLLSTYEDSGFTQSSVALVDGINWVSVSNVGGSPQFSLKVPLTYYQDGPGNAWYAFNNGESVRLSPTTMDQVRRFISTLAVTGFTTAGTVGVVDRGTRLELATNTLGSLGAIQIVSGLANEYQVPILDTGIRLDNSLMTASVNYISGQGINSEQWFRLAASNKQAKELDFAASTSITVIGSYPTASTSTIKLSGRQLDQRFFGKPRHHIRSRGRTFKIEKQGDLVCLSWNGSGTSPAFKKATLNLNDSAGGTVNGFTVGGTSSFQFAIASGNANFNELSIGDLVTISGMTSSVNNGTFLVVGVSDDGKNLQVLNPIGVPFSGHVFSAGNFSASSEVAEGDTITVSAPFNQLNQGQFRVIRRYNDSVWFENSSVAEEEVTLPYNPIGMGFDATTSFNISAANHSQLLTWNGVGTRPNFQAQVGDVVHFGTDFAAANQGAFMVLRASPPLQEITYFTMPSGSQFILSAPGAYFDVNSANNANLYYVWFNVNSSNTDPAVGGRVGLQVNILSSDAATTVAAKAAAVLQAASGMEATSSAEVLATTTIGFGSTTDATAGTMPSPFSINVIQQGNASSLIECVNPSAVNQAAVFVTSNILQTHRPQIQFNEYESTVAGDHFILNNNAFLSNNIGSHLITRVVDRDTVIVEPLLKSIPNVSLNGILGSAYVEEGTAYSGYKHVLFVASQPAAPTRRLITFDSNAQSDKINQSALVQMTSLNKMNSITKVKNGLDSYRYNTGLIAEANRIIYGDPRDSVTYPGVGAAGAEIFVREPLTRRIQVALEIRLNTGVPFAQTSEQVRNSVSSLVNSNDIGQSIAISNIIGAVTSIPGILAVSIDFPQFDSSNDLIILSPGEKAVIIDPNTDISVSQVGS